MPKFFCLHKGTKTVTAPKDMQKNSEILTCYKISPSGISLANVRGAGNMTPEISIAGKMSMPQYCTPEELMQRLKSREEMAVIDVREQGEFITDHVLRASSASLSHLELLLQPLVPCKQVPIIFMDSGEPEDDRAERACACARKMGYTSVLVLQGGLRAWQAAGYVSVDGTSCMAKGYAEHLEQSLHTPGLTPEEIQERIGRGEQVVLLDIRDPEEYAGMAIPGGISTPGCEAAYRFSDLVPSPEVLVVTNCGSRTWGILCAQMLLDFGVPNPVAYMRGGTLNWKLSGYPLELGRNDRTSPPSPQAFDFARGQAQLFAEKYKIAFIDAQTLQAWQDEAKEKTLYLFDVRQSEEYAAVHLEGSRSAPGCQLVQLSDDFAAVRNARYVLIDDTEVRAVITAYWLRQVAIPNVYVLRGGLGGSGISRGRLVTQSRPPHIPCAFKQAIDAAELAQQLTRPNPPLVINVGRSDRHRQGHIPGSVWVPRCWLERVQAHHPRATHIVLTADSESHACLAAADAARLWSEADISFLMGGNPDWERKGLELETGMPVAFGAEDDIWYLTYKDVNADPKVMEAFFDWGHELEKKLLKDGSYQFRLPEAL